MEISTTKALNPFYRLLCAGNYSAAPPHTQQNSGSGLNICCIIMDRLSPKVKLKRKPGKWCVVSILTGMQAQAWSETIRTSDELDSMIFPRLLALAERAWHRADWEDSNDPKERKEKQQADWEAFANTLGYKELRRLEDISIKYRIPLVGARSFT